MNKKFQKAYLSLLLFTAVCLSLSAVFAWKARENDDIFPMGIVTKIFNDASELESFEEIQNVSLPVSQIEISSAAGDIHLVKGQEFRVLYSGYLPRKKIKEGFPWRQKLEAGLLSIEVPSLGSDWFGFVWRDQNRSTMGLVSTNIQVTVEVPTDWSGSLTLKTISGDVNVLGLKTQFLELESTSGDISLESIEAPQARLKTVSGSLDIENSKIEALSAGTTSGEMNLALRAKTLDLASISGEVNLSVGQDRTYEFDLESVSGQILNDSSLEVGPGSPRDLIGKITIKNVSGDIRISRLDESSEEGAAER